MGARDQTACKPGSVPSRGKRRSFLWTAHCWTVLATYPDPRSAGDGAVRPKADMRTPIWSCSRRGLPCRPGHPVRGGLLPHPFTLTLLRRGFAGRFAFCGAIPGVTPGGRYPPPYRRGARTFLPPTRLAPLRRATARPSDPPTGWRGRRKASSHRSAGPSTLPSNNHIQPTPPRERNRGARANGRSVRCRA